MLRLSHRVNQLRSRGTGVFIRRGTNDIHPALGANLHVSLKTHKRLQHTASTDVQYEHKAIKKLLVANRG